MRNLKRIGAVVALAALSLVVGQSANGSTSGDTAKRSIVTFEEISPPTTLDPQKGLLAQDFDAVELSYQCLLKESPAGAVLPELATSYKSSPDGLVYTFALRHGVFFHNGARFTSADVVYTFNRLKTNGIPYDQAQFPTIGTVTAQGPYSVKFTLTQATPGFVFSMANPLGAGCAIVTSHPGTANLALQMIGTGPYAMTSYTPNQELDFQAFSKYWGPKPKNNGLRVLYVPNKNTELADLRSGNADLVIVDSSLVPSLRSAKLKVYPTPPNIIDNLFINNAIKPWSDVRVRQAVALGIDRKAIAKVAYSGAAVPSSFFPPSYKWGLKLADTPYKTRDVKKAKRLLAAAGYPNGLSAKLTYEANWSPDLDREMQLVQSQLAQVGIKLTLDPEESAGYSEKLNGTSPVPSYDLAWLTYGAFFADPFQFLRPRPNRQGPTPAKIQTLINNLTTATTVTAYHNKLNALARAEVGLVFPAIPMVCFQSFFAGRSNLHNVHPLANTSRVFLADISKS